MLIETGNIWNPKRRKPNCWTGITTNGYVASSGVLVMGRGVALQAKQRFPGIECRLANHVRENGNIICLLSDLRLFTFPVKHKWDQDADLNLIASSAEQLELPAILKPEATFYLPRPGCGNGNLRWEDVYPVISFLPDNVVSIHVSSLL